MTAVRYAREGEGDSIGEAAPRVLRACSWVCPRVGLPAGVPRYAGRVSGLRFRVASRAKVRVCTMARAWWRQFRALPSVF